MTTRETIIDALVDAFKEMADTNDYDIRLVDVLPYEINTLILAEGETPVLIIQDNLPEVELARSSTHITLTFDFALYAQVNFPVYEDAVSELNRIQAALKNYLTSDPTLSSNVLSVTLKEDSGKMYSREAGTGTYKVVGNIIYYCQLGSF